MARLDIRGLAVSYFMQSTQQQLDALREVNLSVGDGEFVAIVGPSGCGKTTLLNVVAGLVSPSAGRVVLNGHDVRGPGRDRAMVFQSPALLPWRTVIRNAAFGLEMQGVKRADAERRARAYVELVGLAGFEHSFPRELSGGMQQRVNLARALAIEPDLLLFDEPLAALDAQTREAMQAELQRIWLSDQHTALFVTHQIEEAIFLADRVVVMSPRPGAVREEVGVPLARPRALEAKRSAEFIALEDHVWRLIQSG